jgi:hypothetical protein
VDTESLQVRIQRVLDDLRRTQGTYRTGENKGNAMLASAAAIDLIIDLDKIISHVDQAIRKANYRV